MSCKHCDETKTEGRVFDQSTDLRPGACDESPHKKVLEEIVAEIEPAFRKLADLAKRSDTAVVLVAYRRDENEGATAFMSNVDENGIEMVLKRAMIDMKMRSIKDNPLAALLKMALEAKNV